MVKAREGKVLQQHCTPHAAPAGHVVHLPPLPLPIVVLQPRALLSILSIAITQVQLPTHSSAPCKPRRSAALAESNNAALRISSHHKCTQNFNTHLPGYNSNWTKQQPHLPVT
jgi:hypothetical protein